VRQLDPDRWDLATAPQPGLVAGGVGPGRIPTCSPVARGARDAALRGGRPIRWGGSRRRRKAAAIAQRPALTPAAGPVAVAVPMVRRCAGRSSGLASGGRSRRRRCPRPAHGWCCFLEGMCRLLPSASYCPCWASGGSVTPNCHARGLTRGHHRVGRGGGGGHGLACQQAGAAGCGTHRISRGLRSPADLAAGSHRRSSAPIWFAAQARPAWSWVRPLRPAASCGRAASWPAPGLAR